MDLEAIAILRGPQATLFGRNTSAGALVIRTQAPDLFEPSFFANITASNFSGTRIQAGGSVPVTKNELAVRGSVAVRRQNGFLKSTTEDAESMDRDRISLRGQALWAIDERSDLRIIADYSEADEQCCDGVIVAPGGCRRPEHFRRHSRRHSDHHSRTPHRGRHRALRVDGRWLLHAE